MTLLQYESIIAIVWILYVLVQYSLVPYVVLFEPGHTLTSAFGRSRQLVKKRGRLFILATYTLLALFLMTVYFVAALFENAAGLEKWLTFGITALIALMFFNATLVVLYRKRRLARKN